MKKKLNDSIVNPAEDAIDKSSENKNQENYFEWLKTRFPEEVEMLSREAFLEKLAQLRRDKQ